MSNWLYCLEMLHYALSTREAAGFSDFELNQVMMSGAVELDREIPELLRDDIDYLALKGATWMSSKSTYAVNKDHSIMVCICATTEEKQVTYFWHVPCSKVQGQIENVSPRAVACDVLTGKPIPIQDIIDSKIDPKGIVRIALDRSALNNH